MITFKTTVTVGNEEFIVTVCRSGNTVTTTTEEHCHPIVHEIAAANACLETERLYSWGPIGSDYKVNASTGTIMKK